MKLKSILWITATAVTLLGSTYVSQAQTKEKTVMVGGAPMYPSKNIIENAVNSKDHTTLVAAVKAAGLVETLAGPGPFTVLAPTNNAFAKVPKEALNNLMLPENKAKLTSILTYHVIPGKWSAAQISKAIKDGKGMYIAKSVQGGDLTFWMKGKDVYVKDAQGNSAKVTVADVNQSNGVIHVIDAVLMP
ncbi:fasciclin domain-containing protein [Sphingobacterium detergens]|uniref:Putative surface protein with fasciclin (FAS1) repeats n=1 Tax=Sphingobacterium detergens TaxID=1145106 RepID=A0A420BH28_SPHD1|nr:fasciclin domain-containing protein [Sphingobacterium detergens]RKE55999.1 putative surface protein with fasciclin (FAS1) repeats [Sphingobacterium detergens]